MSGASARLRARESRAQKILFRKRQRDERNETVAAIYALTPTVAAVFEYVDSLPPESRVKCPACKGEDKIAHHTPVGTVRMACRFCVGGTLRPLSNRAVAG